MPLSAKQLAILKRFADENWVLENFSGQTYQYCIAELSRELIDADSKVPPPKEGLN